MILIISIANDASTASVMSWLLKYNQDVIRINSDDKIKLSNINIANNTSGCNFIHNNRIINIDDIKSVWYRRGRILFEEEEFPFINSIEKSKNLGEFRILKNFIYNKLKEKKSLSEYSKRSVNKLSVLECAKKNGLIIPPTLVTSNKEQLLEFQSKHGEIITKAIYEMPRKGGVNGYMMYTEIVSEAIVQRLPDTFFTSLFQKCLDKKFEIRIFYINQKFFSMSIHSQAEDQTKTDFRKYIKEKPNRTAPFNLPSYIKKKIITLMETLGLNCGSIDMVYTQQSEFVFLEVNPVGQYGMTSGPCNYNVDKIICEYLMN